MSQESLARYIESRSRSDFDAFVRSSRTRTLKTAERICRDRKLAADLVQELYTSLFLEPPGLEEVRQLRLYLTMRLVGLARTRKRCEVRRAAREERHREMRSVVVNEPGPEDAWDVNEAVAGLPETLRQVVEMRYYAELQVQEIASTLATTPRTVLNRITRAAGILRTKLASSVAAVVCAALLGRSQAEAAASRPRRPALTAALSAAALLVVTVGGAWLWQQVGPRAQARPVVADAGDAAGTPTPVAERVIPPGEKPGPASRVAEAADRRARPEANTPVAAVMPPAPSTARLSLRVVDESGAPVTSGTVDFSPSARTDLQRGLQRIAGALPPSSSRPSRRRRPTWTCCRRCCSTGSPRSS